MPPTKTSFTSSARVTLPKELRQFIRPLVEKADSLNIPLYLVGGCVRDLLLGKKSLDVDLVVEGPGETLARAGARALKAKLVSHPEFLTHTLQLPNGRHLDIATARIETYAEPAVLPMVEPASLQDDLFRRDFSINALAVSLNASDTGHVWDPFGGVEDLQQGRVRVLHADSFRDDPTRIFRAGRFAGRFEYSLEWRTREWLNEAAGQQLPGKLSGARLREELTPLLMERDPRPALRLLSDWGVLGFLIPNVKWEKSHETLFAHVLKGEPKENSLLMRLLALVHSLPVTKAVGALEHLMYPQSLIEQIEQALQILGRVREGTLSAADARSAARKPLTPAVRTFLEKAIRTRCLVPKKENIDQWNRYHDATPCLSGQDIRDLGYKPGPLFSQIFDALRKARWEGKLRTREEEIRFLGHVFPLGNA
jgi:tRNA nucleotidyltransferase (CCA-adding enzyme)